MTPEQKADLYAAVQDYYRRRRRLNLKTAGAIGAGMAAEYMGRDPYAIMDRILRPASRPAQLDPTEQAEAQKNLLDLARRHDEAYLDAGKDKLEAIKARQQIKDDILKQAVDLYKSVKINDKDLRKSRNDVVKAMGSDVQTALRQVISTKLSTEDQGKLLIGLDLSGTANIVSQLLGESTPALEGERGEVSGNLLDKLYAAFVPAAGVPQDPDTQAMVIAQLKGAAGVDGKDLDTYLTQIGAGLAGEPEKLDRWNEIAAVMQNTASEAWTRADALLSTAISSSQLLNEELLKNIAGSQNFDSEEFKKIYNTLLKPGGEETGDLAAAVEEGIANLPDLVGMPDEERQKYNDALDQLTDDANISNPSLTMVREQIYESPAFKEYMQETGIVDPLMALKQLKKEMKAKHRGAIAESRRKMRQRDQQLEQAAAEGEPDELLGATPELSPLGVKSMPFTERVEARPSVKQRLRGKLFELGGQQRAVPGTPDRLPEDDEEDERKLPAYTTVR